jgi:hypothetical protein
VSRDKGKLVCQLCHDEGRDPVMEWSDRTQIAVMQLHFDMEHDGSQIHLLLTDKNGKLTGHMANSDEIKQESRATRRRAVRGQRSVNKNRATRKKRRK